jgi:hypothetical protein
MTKVELGFVPDPFEKRVIQQTKDDIAARLDGHEISQVKIVLKKRPDNQIAFQFVGDPDNVEKAKRLLGIY